MDTPVGHLHLALTDPPEIQDVEVRASYRRRGVATALVGAAERGASARGFETVNLEMSVTDSAAMSRYRACGSVDAGLPTRRVQGPILIQTGWIEVDDTLATWRKRLSEPGPAFMS